MMGKQKCDCFHCVHGGISDQRGILCDILYGEGPIEKHPLYPERKIRVVKTPPLIDECENYIPTLDEEDLDIESHLVADIEFKCPFCGYEDTLYDVDGLHYDEVVACYNCEKKFRIYYERY